MDYFKELQNLHTLIPRMNHNDFVPINTIRGRHIAELILLNSPKGTLVISSDIEHCSMHDLIYKSKLEKYDSICFNIYKGETIEDFVEKHKVAITQASNVLIMMIGVNTYTGIRIKPEVSINLKEKILKYNPKVEMCRDAIHEFLLFENQQYDEFDYILGYNHAIFGKEMSFAGGWIKKKHLDRFKILYEYLNVDDCIRMYFLYESQVTEAYDRIMTIYESKHYLLSYRSHVEHLLKLLKEEISVTSNIISAGNNPYLEDTEHIVAFNFSNKELSKEFIFENSPLHGAGIERMDEVYDEMFPELWEDPFIYNRATEILWNGGIGNHIDSLHDNLKEYLK